jgi:hypothetical protein
MLALRESLEGKYCLRVIDVERDGNCLFRSIQAFMDTRVIPSAGAGGATVDTWNHLAIRQATVDFIRSFRSHFTQFLPPGGDEVYLTNMAKNGTWGGEPEIVALTNILQRSIEIYIRNPVTNHAQHERTYVPFTPFRTLNDVAPIRLLYFNGTGGPVPNHYALLVPCNAENKRLFDMTIQARTHAFERITIGRVVTTPRSTNPPSVASSNSFENSSNAAVRLDIFDMNNNDDVEFDELPEYDFEVPRMPFASASAPAPASVAPAPAPPAPAPAPPAPAPAPPAPAQVRADDDAGPPPAKRTKKGRSYYAAFEDNMAHGHDRLISDVMAKAEVACRTCGCKKCAAVSNHENAFEMFVRKPKSPAEACLLHKIWVMHHRRR